MKLLLAGLDAESVKVCDFPLFTINSKKPAFFTGIENESPQEIYSGFLYAVTLPVV